MNTDQFKVFLRDNQEAEIAILGAFLSGVDLGFEEAGAELTDGHFSSRSHKIILKAIREMQKEGLPVDCSTVSIRINEQGDLDSVGGSYYLSKISSCFCTSTHFKYYVSLLSEAYKLRKIVEIADQCLSAVRNASHDSSEIMATLDSSLTSLSISDNSDNQNRLNPASIELQRMIDVRKAGEKVFGLSSGIQKFDEIYGGFQKGQYYVVAARPSSGKTAFADQIAVYLVTRGHPVLYVSLEASEERLLGKMACKLAKVSFSDFSLGKCSMPELSEVEAALNVLKKSPLIIIRPSDFNSKDIRSLIRREFKSRKIELVVLDYLQKVTIPPRVEPRIAIGDASQQIARSCVDTGVPALVIAQINRESEREARPRMGHLKESGQIEQDADNIGLLWSEVDRNTLLPGANIPICFTVEKNRDGISQVDQKLLFNGRIMTFENRM